MNMKTTRHVEITLNTTDWVKKLFEFIELQLCKTLLGHTHILTYAYEVLYALERKILSSFGPTNNEAGMD